MRSVSPYLLRRRTVVERQVISLLRGALGCARSRDRRLLDLWSGSGDVFTHLGNSVRIWGLAVLAPGALCISFDEMRVVRWLAVAQRQDLSIAEPLPISVRSQIQGCASLLSAAGLKLPLSSIIFDRMAGAPGTSLPGSMAKAAAFAAASRGKS